MKETIVDEELKYLIKQVNDLKQLKKDLANCLKMVDSKLFESELELITYKNNISNK